MVWTRITCSVVRSQREGFLTTISRTGRTRSLLVNRTQIYLQVNFKKKLDIAWVVLMPLCFQQKHIFCIIFFFRCLTKFPPWKRTSMAKMLIPNIFQVAEKLQVRCFRWVNELLYDSFFISLLPRHSLLYQAHRGAKVCICKGIQAR